VPALWVGLAAWATLAALAVIAWRRFGTAGRCLVAGLILLIPSSSIFPAADLAADRRMYLPMLAFTAAMALILEPLLDGRSQQPRRAAAAVLVVILMAVTLERTYVWMHEESLWREAVERAPGKVRPKIQLARALPAAKALELLAQARNLAPHDPSVAAETGKILLAEGQVDPALAEFGRALALDPRDARNFNNRGLALAALGQTEAARADFRRALEIAPGLIEAEQNLRKLQAP